MTYKLVWMKYTDSGMIISSVLFVYKQFAFDL